MSTVRAQDGSVSQTRVAAIVGIVVLFVAAVVGLVMLYRALSGGGTVPPPIPNVTSPRMTGGNGDGVYTGATLNGTVQQGTIIDTVQSTLLITPGSPSDSPLNVTGSCTALGNTGFTCTYYHDPYMARPGDKLTFSGSVSNSSGSAPFDASLQLPPPAPLVAVIPKSLLSFPGYPNPYVSSQNSQVVLQGTLQNSNGAEETATGCDVELVWISAATGVKTSLGAANLGTCFPVGACQIGVFECSWAKVTSSELFAAGDTLQFSGTITAESGDTATIEETWTIPKVQLVFPSAYDGFTMPYIFKNGVSSPRQQYDIYVAGTLCDGTGNAVDIDTTQGSVSLSVSGGPPSEDTIWGMYSDNTFEANWNDLELVSGDTLTITGSMTSKDGETADFDAEFSAAALRIFWPPVYGGDTNPDFNYVTGSSPCQYSVTLTGMLTDALGEFVPVDVPNPNSQPNANIVLYRNNSTQSIPAQVIEMVDEKISEFRAFWGDSGSGMVLEAGDTLTFSGYVVSQGYGSLNFSQQFTVPVVPCPSTTSRFKLW